MRYGTRFASHTGATPMSIAYLWSDGSREKRRGRQIAAVSGPSKLLGGDQQIYPT